MKVRIVKDWDFPNFLRQTPGGKGFWDDIEFTDKRGISCDVLVTLNVPDRNFFSFCRKGGRWLMSQEPPHQSYEWQTKSYKSFDTIYTFWKQSDFPEHKIINTQTSLPWHVNKSYDELIGLECPKDKKEEVSWITSNLQTRPGHLLRLSFIEFLQKRKFPFHLYGRGFQPIDDKFQGIYPFKYSIAVENYYCPDYWTEKIADCFLSWTMPIYFGCTNIKNYFPPESMLLVDLNNQEEALNTIQEAISSDKWSKSLEYIKEARELVLNKYQFFPSIAEKIKAAGLDKSRRSLHFIRKPG